MGRSEELGTGIKKVYNYSKMYSGSDKIEFLEQDIFITRVSLGNVFHSDNFTDNFTDNKRLSKILSLIAKNNRVKTTELAQLLNVTRRTIASDIALLKEHNILRRIGSDKSGFWEILKKEK